MSLRELFKHKVVISDEMVSDLKKYLKANETRKAAFKNYLDFKKAETKRLKKEQQEKYEEELKSQKEENYHYQGKDDPVWQIRYKYEEPKLEEFSLTFESFLETKIEDRKELLEDLKNLSDDEAFKKEIIRLIDEKHLKDSKVYKRALLSRQYFHSILNDKLKISKLKALQLCIGLELNLEEAERLLSYAGYCLNDLDSIDLLFKFAFVKGIYNMEKINLLIYELANITDATHEQISKRKNKKDGA